MPTTSPGEAGTAENSLNTVQHKRALNPVGQQTLAFLFEIDLFGIAGPLHSPYSLKVSFRNPVKRARVLFSVPVGVRNLLRPKPVSAILV